MKKKERSSEKQTPRVHLSPPPISACIPRGPGWGRKHPRQMLTRGTVRGARGDFTLCSSRGCAQRGQHWTEHRTEGLEGGSPSSWLHRTCKALRGKRTDVPLFRALWSGNRATIDNTLFLPSADQRGLCCCYQCNNDSRKALLPVTLKRADSHPTSCVSLQKEITLISNHYFFKKKKKTAFLGMRMIYKYYTYLIL